MDWVQEQCWDKVRAHHGHVDRQEADFSTAPAESQSDYTQGQQTSSHGSRNAFPGPRTTQLTVSSWNAAYGTGPTELSSWGTSNSQVIRAAPRPREEIQAPLPPPVPGQTSLAMFPSPGQYTPIQGVERGRDIARTQMPSTYQPGLWVWPSSLDPNLELPSIEDKPCSQSLHAYDSSDDGYDGDIYEPDNDEENMMLDLEIELPRGYYLVYRGTDGTYSSRPSSLGYIRYDDLAGNEGRDDWSTAIVFGEDDNEVPLIASGYSWPRKIKDENRGPMQAYLLPTQALEGAMKSYVAHITAYTPSPKTPDDEQVESDPDTDVHSSTQDEPAPTIKLGPGRPWRRIALPASRTGSKRLERPENSIPATPTCEGSHPSAPTSPPPRFSMNLCIRLANPEQNQEARKRKRGADGSEEDDSKENDGHCPRPVRARTAPPGC